MRVGVLGGSFDPPHLAHLFACCHAVSSGGVDRVLLVPVFAHALGKQLTPFEHRLAMCQLAIEPYGERFEVSDIERKIGGTSYTVDTLQRLLADRPDDHLALILGSDALAERDAWKDFDRIEQLVELIVVGRQGLPRPSDAAPFDLPAISSTDIRDAVARGDAIEGLVPAAVARYIEREGLYR